MSRRTDQKKLSTAWLQLRVAEEERDEIHATAQYLGQSTSDYLRGLHRAKRAELVKEGLRPPKSPRDPGS